MPKIAGKQKPYEKQPGFPDQNSAEEEANKLGQELEYIPLESVDSEFPIEDAMFRSETYQLGGMVKPPTAPSISPTPQYKKGGKVK
tara:strand:+ start:1041 stop:1298 length:258 start_codon:yes stop_codon:yes gene_type:complete